MISDLLFFQSDFIYYVHNGSDTLTDNFAIMAKSGRGDKQSNPHTINIEVIPTNDQPPRVVVNNPLHVWTGECAGCAEKSDPQASVVTRIHSSLTKTQYSPSQ